MTRSLFIAILSVQFTGCEMMEDGSDTAIDTAGVYDTAANDLEPFEDASNARSRVIGTTIRPLTISGNNFAATPNKLAVTGSNVAVIRAKDFYFPSSGFNGVKIESGVLGLANGWGACAPSGSCEGCCASLHSDWSTMPSVTRQVGLRSCFSGRTISPSSKLTCDTFQDVPPPLPLGTLPSKAAEFAHK